MTQRDTLPSESMQTGSSLGSIINALPLESLPFPQPVTTQQWHANLQQQQQFFFPFFGFKMPPPTFDAAETTREDGKILILQI